MKNKKINFGSESAREARKRKFSKRKCIFRKLATLETNDYGEGNAFKGYPFPRIHRISRMFLEPDSSLLHIPSLANLESGCLISFDQ